MTFLLRMQEFLRSGTELPTLPASVFQLQSALSREEVSLAELVPIVESDAPLAARILRAANSALYARGGDRVAALGPAIGRLGFSQLKSVALAGSVLQVFSARSASLRPERFWAHSAAVGAAARALAATLRRSDLDPEVCYTAGLLHDVGLLVLDQFFPEDYAIIAGQRQELGLPWWQQEEDTLGLDHGEIGGLMLGHWRLPNTIVDAVSFHHRPSMAPAAILAETRVVHAAEVVVAREALALPDEGMETADLEEAMRRAGCGDRIEEVVALMVAAVHESPGVLG